MLAYDENLIELTGVGSVLDSEDLVRFEQRARAAALPYRSEGAALAIWLRE